MQLTSSENLNCKKEGMSNLESCLIKSTIVLAPDLVELPRLIDNIRLFYSHKFREIKLARLIDLAKKSYKAEEDAENICHYFDEIMAKMKWIFSHKGKVDFKNEGEKQACMWLLCTLLCDNFQLPNKKNVFYTGVGFGEYWALTYRMYQLGQISFREAVWLTKSRGERMSLLMDKYYMVTIKEEDRSFLCNMLPKNSKVGILTLKQNRHYLYGTEEELKRVAKHYKVEMKESLPYFSQYISRFIYTYAKKFPFAEAPTDSQLILSREVESIEQLIIKQCCNKFNERAIRQEIAYYEPYTIKEI